MDKLKVFVHSQRSGNILRGSAPRAWIEEGQTKNFEDRTTMVRVRELELAAAFQPLWSNGNGGIEEFRHSLENEIARVPKGTTVVIGGITIPIWAGTANGETLV